MAVITLTTDFGTHDYYAAALTGALLSQLPGAQVVSVSHEVSKFNLAEGCFILQHTYPQFPAGTVHLIGINSAITPEYRPVCVQHEGHFFVGTDNGFFNLLFPDVMPQAVELELDEARALSSFPELEVYAPVCAFLASGGDMASLGSSLSGFRRSLGLPLVVDQTSIRGAVQYIDSYSNLITNIHRSVFERVGQGRAFTIVLSRQRHNIDEISDRYSSVPTSEMVALFNSAGWLEIAIYMGVKNAGGGAEQLLGMSVSDRVTVEFYAI